MQAPGRRTGVVFILLILLATIPHRVDGSTIAVPIKLDYPLLRQLLIKQLFTIPGQSAEILNDPSGCSQVVLANPRLGEKSSDLEILTEVEARLGVKLGGSCTNLLQWEGSAGFLVRPIIQPGATSVRLKPIDSWLVAPDGGKITSGRIWDLAKVSFHPLFSRFTLDLAPSIKAVAMVLPGILPRQSSLQLQKIVNSLRLSGIQISPTGLDVSIDFEIEELAEQPHSEAPLTDKELQQWETRWQMMDALFTLAVKHYASATSHQELRHTLLENLLDSRHRLSEALTAPTSRSNDPVRRWFLDSWKRLNPVIRRIGLEQTGQEPLVWISLLAATDVLYALDRIAPSVGLEISADGLRRLARLVNEKAGTDTLRYDQAVDPELQRLFQLPPAEPEQPSGRQFPKGPVRSPLPGASTDRLNRWVPGKNHLDEYLPLVSALLTETAEEALETSKLQPPVAKLFRELVLATAWQESCWRQYVTNKNKLEPLRSSTGDVGLMQINEKVWRGLYDIQNLRWDIAYNSRAGTRVLLDYLVEYALKQGEHKRPGGLDNLAKATYSAYNGGPGQVSRYRNPGVSSTHKRIDAAFWKKYLQVKAGNELNVAECLDGEPTDSAGKGSASKSARKSADGKKKEAAAGIADEGWVLAQDDNRFTLQLAVFSERQSAQKFIAQKSLSGQVAIYWVRKGQTNRFAVLYGSYGTRTDADRDLRRLKHLKPWLRQFGEIRKIR